MAYSFLYSYCKVRYLVENIQMNQIYIVEGQLCLPSLSMNKIVSIVFESSPSFKSTWNSFCSSLHHVGWRNDLLSSRSLLLFISYVSVCHRSSQIYPEWLISLYPSEYNCSKIFSGWEYPDFLYNSGFHSMLIIWDDPVLVLTVVRIHQ